MSENYLSKWQAVADDVISVLLGNPARWVEALESGVAVRDMPPGYWQTVYKVAVEMASEQVHNTALMDTAIAIQAGVGVSVEWVAERMALYDSLRESVFDNQLETVKKYGAIHRAIETLKRGTVTMTAAANNGLNYEAPMQNVMRDLQQEQMVNVNHVVDLGSLMGENKAAMESDPFPRAETGLWLLDKWVTTMRPNAFIAQVGPYKMRKTSLMSNSVIHRLRQGDQVDVFTFDESRRDFIYRLEAMLMAEYMWNNECYDHPLNNINGETIMMAGKKWRDWPDILQKAFQYAFDTLAGFNKKCRIYDMETCRPNAASVTALCRADAMKNGGLGTIYVDHLQSFTGGKLFEIVEGGSTELHALRGELNCRMWLLAQQNEEAIKNSVNQHSPMVKGSGGLAAKADTIIMSRYNYGVIEGFPCIVQIRLNNARNHEGNRAGYMQMHPASGWVTPRGKGRKKLKMKDFLQELKDIGTENLNETLNEAIGAPM